MLRKRGESKPKGKERLAVCADGETSVDPAMSSSDGGYESLAVPCWPRDCKRKYRYSLILYFIATEIWHFVIAAETSITWLKLTAFEKLS